MELHITRKVNIWLFTTYVFELLELDRFNYCTYNAKTGGGPVYTLRHRQVRCNNQKIGQLRCARTPTGTELYCTATVTHGASLIKLSQLSYNIIDLLFTMTTAALTIYYVLTNKLYSNIALQVRLRETAKPLTHKLPTFTTNIDFA